MIAQGDATRFGRHPWNKNDLSITSFLTPTIWGSNFMGSISRRHLGKANVLFADGHVGSETIRQLLYPSVENWTRWNYDNKKHWPDSLMLDVETWQSPTPLDETLSF